MPLKRLIALTGLALLAGCASSTPTNTGGTPSAAPLSAPTVAASAPTATPAASPSAGSSLTGRPWSLTYVTSKTPAFQGVVPAEQQPDYTITFNTDGTYSGKAACNQIAGTYKTSGDSLTITAGASTLAFCPDSDF